MLESVVDQIWTVARRAKFWGVETGSRMTIVRLSEGGLFVHSPLAMDEETRREVDLLGEVRAVVSPSIFHHLHVRSWMEVYPKAVFAACPGLDRKRPDLAFSTVLGDEPHAIWARDLAQVYFSARRENEGVFFHRQSRTLVCADAPLSLSSHPFPSTRLVARLIGNSAPGLG